MSSVWGYFHKKSSVGSQEIGGREELQTTTEPFFYFGMSLSSV